MTWRGTGAIAKARVQGCSTVKCSKMLWRQSTGRAALRFPPLLQSFDALCFPPLACMHTRFCSPLKRLPGLRSLLLSSLSVACCRHFPGVDGGFFECDTIVSRRLDTLWNIHRFHKQCENLDYEPNLKIFITMSRIYMTQ